MKTRRIAARAWLVAVLAFIGWECMAPAQAMMIKREIKDPVFDFSLSEAEKCKFSPDPHRVAGSSYFLIECESDVSKVKVTFITNPAALSVYDLKGSLLSSLTVYPTSGSVQSYFVKTCGSATSPDSCTTYQLDVARSDGKAPRLAYGGLTFSHFPVQPPKFDPSALTYDVQLFAKEPVIVAARADPNYFVDFETGFPERGHIARSAYKTYTPQCQEGEVEPFNIYVVNADRSAVVEYTINVHCVRSTNARLGQVDVSPGRLDPVFRPHKYAYFLRIPEGSRKLSLSMTAVNDRDTQCFVQPEGLALEQGVTAHGCPLMNKVKAWMPTTTTTEAPKPIRESIPIGSSGSVTFRFPKLHRSGNIVVDCVAADDTYKVRYVFTVVPQFGGSTLLEDLEVVSHPFDRDFDARAPGPYKVNVDATATDEDTKKWFSFRVTPTNRRAICKVEGREVDPQTHLSSYFRVLLGEKRQFRISVRTPENPVEEEYFVIISRPAPWYKDARVASRIADWVGITSSTVSAMKGITFINNAKFLHFISMSNRLNGNPETYDAYSQTLNKWNLQWEIPSQVYFVDKYHNTTFVAPPEDYAEILAELQWSSSDNNLAANWFGGKEAPKEGPADGEGDASKVEDAAADVTGAVLPPKLHMWGADLPRQGGAAVKSAFGIDNIDDWDALLKQATSKLQMWEAPIQSLGSDVAANAVWRPAYSNGPVFEAAVSRVMSEIVHEKINAAQRGGALPLLGGEGPLRALLPEDSDSVHSIIRRLDADYKAQQSLLDFCGSIVITSIALLAIEIIYASIWVLYLRDVRGGWTTIRQDFPAILKPSRFWIFCLDYALITYLQSCAGILFSQGNRDAAIRLFGMTVTPNQLTWVAGSILLVIPVAFVAYCIAVLFRIRQGLLFTKTFQRYGDNHSAELKATQRFFKWVPLLSHLFTVEITSVAPVTRHPTTQPNVSDGELRFSEESRTEAPWLVGCPENIPSRVPYIDVERGMKGNDYDALLGEAGEQRIRHREKGDLIKATVPHDTFESRLDTVNPALYNRFPEAFVGFSKYKIQNPYDYITNVRAEVQLRHLTSLMNLQSYVLWVPRENLSQDHVDDWNLLFGKSQKGNAFYWIVDRCVTAAIIFFLALWSDRRGVTHAFVFGCVCLLLVAIYLPSAMATATSKWFRVMENEAEKKQRAKHFEQVDERRFKVWPFRRRGVRGAFLEVRQRKREQEMWGMYNFWESFVVDPIQEICEMEFWRTRCFLTVKACLEGPVFAELMKFCTLFTLFLGNYNIGVYGNGVASVWGMILTIMALVCLNTSSLKEWMDELKLMCQELWLLTRRFFINVCDFFNEPQTMGRKIVHFFSACQRVLQGEKGVSFQHPGFAGEKVRDYHVDEVCIINNEVGVHLPGRIEHPPKLHREMKFSDCMQRRRFGLHKTLYIKGSLGVHRCTLDRAMPIQLPFKQFFHLGKGPDASNTIQRLAATIQIVNFNESRAVTGYQHSADDDSFMSLFTDPKLMPEYGKVRRKHQGHGYVVRWLRSKEMIFIRGPAIMEGEEYSVTTVGEKAPVDEEDVVSASSSETTLEEFGRAGHDSAQVMCWSSGRIVVAIPEGSIPDTRCPVRVSRAEEAFVIDPDDVKIEYFDYRVGRLHRRELLLRSSRLTRSAVPYTITWTVRTRGKKINATARAPAHGVLYVPWTGDEAPDLTSPIAIRNETEQSKLNGSVIDVDPRETDAHQFILPPIKYSGMARIVASGLSFMRNFGNTIAGRDPSKDVLDEPLLCTVVQCVNPLERQYRVEPNFEDAMNRVKARVEELRGLKKDLDTPERLGDLWSNVMSTSEFISFWNGLGVNIVVGGSWINPLTNTNHMYIRENLHRVRDGQMKFKAEIAVRIDSRIGLLSNLLDRYKVWNKAFNDADLYAGQLRRDDAEWRADRPELFEGHVAGLQTIKKGYLAALMDFQYPMVVEDRLICRPEKFDAQLFIWREQLTAWLLQCEGGSLSPEQGGKACIQAMVDDVMRALGHSIRKAEHAHSGLYRTVLHYVISSVGVRGPDINWKPDPLAAHYCMVRLFAADAQDPSRVDWQKERWTPCFLKLSGTRIMMLFPHEKDATTPTPAISEADALDRWSWNQIQGYFIPLECFEKMFLSIDPSIAEDTTVSDEVRRMHAKLVLKKNTEIHVDDDYVKSVETGDFADEIRYGEEQAPWKIRLGHTVRNRHHQEYRHDDRFFHGDRCTVLPLTFRFHHSYFNKWQSAIRLAQLNNPPKELGGFSGRRRDSDTAFSSDGSEVEPKAPIESSSSSASSDTSSMYDSSSSDSESRLSKKTESVTVDKSSEQAPPPPKPEPAPVGGYKGKFRDGRFTGKNGRLYDSQGRVVYEGDWLEGQRWGMGRCIFRDAEGVEWEFDGEFIADEMRRGKLRMVDDRETDKLRNSTNREDRFRIVAYEGRFKLPRSLRATVRGGANRDIRRMRSNCGVRVPPNISPMFMKNLFDTGEPVDGPALVDRELVIDIRRAVSACADEDTAQATTAWIQNNYGRLKATRFTRQGSGDSSESDITIDAVNALEEYLPHRSRWTRLLDPNAGYQSVPERFVDGDVIFADGSRYRGEMRNGKPDGRGILFCPRCSVVCSGNWKQGRPHGYSVLTIGEQGSSERLEYYGNFAEGKREGRGVQLAQNGRVILKGDFKDDKLHGPNCAIEVADDVTSQFPFTFKRYIGAVEDGLPHGKGKVTWPDGVTYKGEFQNGKRHGQGGMKDKHNRPIISGGWVGDFPEGPITAMILGDGKTIYTGEMKQGQRQGMGELYKGGDAIYEGLWMNDVPNGRGILRAKDGDYEGDFRLGKRHGKGEFIFKDHPSPKGKRVYKGDWKNDKPDGTGRYLDETGQETTFRFKEGELLSTGTRRSGRNAAVTFAVQSAPVVSQDTEHWGLKRKIDTETVRQLNSQGTGVWQSHEDHEFRFMDPNDSPRMADTLDDLARPAKQTSLQSLASSEQEILEIRVIEARDLPNPEPDDPLDPYCKVNFGPHTKKTKPINKAGANPRWNSKLIFPKVGGTADFQVWNKDPLTLDEFIGSGEFDVSNFLASGSKTSQVEIPLRRDGGDAGVVVVQFTTNSNRFAASDSVSQSTLQTKKSAPNVQGIQQLCQIQVHSVADLFCTEPMGQMDPYLKFELGSNKVQTDVKRGGGKNATLDFTLTMPFNNEPSLRLEVWDHDRFSRDDLVGYGTVNLSTFTTGEVEIFRDDKRQGHMSAGMVNLSVTIVRR